MTLSRSARVTGKEVKNKTPLVSSAPGGIVKAHNCRNYSHMSGETSYRRGGMARGKNGTSDGLNRARNGRRDNIDKVNAGPRDNIDTANNRSRNGIDTVVSDGNYGIDTLHLGCSKSIDTVNTGCNNRIDRATSRPCVGRGGAANKNSNNPLIIVRPTSNTDELDLGLKETEMSMCQSFTLVSTNAYPLKASRAPALRQNHRVYRNSDDMKIIQEFAENLPDSRGTKNALSYQRSGTSRNSTNLPFWSVFYDAPRYSHHDLAAILDSYSGSLGELNKRSNDEPYRESVRLSHTKFFNDYRRLLRGQTSTNARQLSGQTPPEVDEGHSLPLLLDTKIRITSAADISQREETKRRFDNYTACLVPAERYGSAVTLRQHREWLASRRCLASTQQTSHVEYSTNRRLFREDCKKAFSSARIPTVRRSPTLIIWPRPRDSGTFGDQGRNRWYLAAEGNTRVDRAGVGSPRFYPWAGYDQAEVKVTTCYFLHLAPAPHQRPEPPVRSLREATELWDQLEREEMQEKRAKFSGKKNEPEITYFDSTSTSWTGMSTPPIAPAGRLRFGNYAVSKSELAANKSDSSSENTSSLHLHKPAVASKKPEFSFRRSDGHLGTKRWS